MIGKRGQAFTLTWKMFYWLLVSVALVITAFIIVSFFSRFISSALSTPQEGYNEVYVQRFIGSPSCFAYQDPITGRVLVGVIDVRKFNDNVLRNCYSPGSGSPGYRLQLRDLERAAGNPPRFASTENFQESKGETFAPIFVWVRQSDGTLHKGKLFASTG